MTPLCASNAHSSSKMCAFYAHDNSVRLLHYWGMDVEWFKSRKKAQGLTDASLAKKVGVERSVMNRWMNGKVGLDAYRVDKVADALASTPEEVLFRAGVPITDPGASSNADVLTSAFETLLRSVGLAPDEDERARKLARRFPDALRRASNLHAGFPEDEDSDLGEFAHGPDEGQPEA